MDVDDFLRSTDLPDVSVNADDALERTTRRGRSRRHLRMAVTGVGCGLVIVGIAAVTLNLPGRGERAAVSSGPGIEAEPPHDPEPGDPAVWTTDRDAPPSPTASTFTALVTRLGCNGGVTGRVLRPGVIASDTEIIITVTVEAAGPGDHTCPGNDPVPYEVDLGRALGDRDLVDGTCQPGGAARRTSRCEGGAVRFQHRSKAVAVQSIEVSTSQDGAQKIEFVFDDPLPDDRVTYIEDIASADTPGVAYMIQDPMGVHVCDAVHSFGVNATGTIDVLIPSGWFDPSTRVEQLAPKIDPPVGHPGKIVACGPYKGYVQYSIWGPASNDPRDVRVTLSDDSTRIVVDVQPGTG